AVARPPELMKFSLGGPELRSAACLRGLFNVTRRSARIAGRGRRDARLITAGTAAGRGTLRPAPTNAGGSGVLELLAHAIELRRVLRAEPTALLGRLRTVTSTTTTHRHIMIARSPASARIRGGLGVREGGATGFRALGTGTSRAGLKRRSDAVPGLHPGRAGAPSCSTAGMGLKPRDTHRRRPGGVARIGSPPESSRHVAGEAAACVARFQ